MNCATYVLQFVMWWSCFASVLQSSFFIRGKTAAKEVGCIDFLLPIIMSFLLVSFILLIVVIYHFIDKC